MDGVLVDTEKLHIAAWREFFSKRGVVLNEQDEAHIHGVRGVDIVRRFMPEKTHEEAAALRNEKAEIFDRLVESGIELIPGVRDLLTELQAGGIPCAVATSAKRERAERQLTHVGITEFFSAVVTADDVSKGKPDPEIYLTAVRLLSKMPHECVVFEDAHSGVEAARKAGTKVVAVLTSHEREDFTGVDDAIQNFEGINYSDLVAHLSR